MSQVPMEEFYNVQRNILDRVGDNSIDDDELKGIAALFGIDILQRLIQRKKDTLDSNVNDIKEKEIIRNGRNEVLWNKRNQVLENNKLINEQSPEVFFDAQAEVVFNNPKTHENSDILKDNPDFVFNPQEFEDRNSPMYKVKQEWKRKYINQVLLPTHLNKYNNIDQTILTFDEYNANNRELTKHAEEYAKRPSERSLLRQWNLFGKKRTAQLKSNYDKAIKQNKRITLEREGYLLNDFTPSLFDKDPLTGDTYGSTLRGTLQPFSGITKDLYAKGEVYNEFEFTNTDEFKNLSLQGRQLALTLFKDNETFGDKNNSYELLNIFTSVSLLEEEQRKQTIFNNIKYNDEDFKDTKPERQAGQTRSKYELSPEYIAWKTNVDEAYKKGTTKYVNARQQAGYTITRSEEINLAIEENLDYIAEVREQKRQLQENEITQEEYNLAIEDFKNKTITNVIEKELNTTDKKQEFIEGIAQDRINDFQTTLRTSKGIEEMEAWFENYNLQRVDAGKNPEPPSNMVKIYSAVKIKSITDDTSFLTNLLMFDALGNVGVDIEQLQEEYNIDGDLL
tara:strand:+ start:1846 stop:3540 length:1695 start_codon:yes stop_codon:yes gene_type:complete